MALATSAEFSVEKNLNPIVESHLDTQTPLINQRRDLVSLGRLQLMHFH